MECNTLHGQADLEFISFIFAVYITKCKQSLVMMSYAIIFKKHKL